MASAQKLAGVNERRFILFASIRWMHFCGIRVCKSSTLRPRLDSVSQSELAGRGTWQGRGKHELNLGGKFLGNDDRAPGGPFHRQRVPARGENLDTLDFRRDPHWFPR